MKKKIKAKDLREMKKAEQKKRFITVAEKTIAEEIKAPEKADVIVNSSKPAEKIKSKSKAAGMKSVLIKGKDMYITTFGKGNSAVVEHKIDSADFYAVSRINKNPSIYINNVDKNDIHFSSDRPFGRNEELSTSNPIASKAAQNDNLGFKAILEDKYFGKTFEDNDNIHIQIIYNILDIEKILAIYSTSIATTINNMLSDELKDNTDFIGYMSAANTYDVFLDPNKNSDLKEKEKKNIQESHKLFVKLMKTGRLGYFGFDYKYNPKNPKKSREEEKRIYHLIALAGQFRQWCVHSTKHEDSIYNFTTLGKPINKEYFSTLDFYFDKRYNELNDEFIKQNKVNLFILTNVLKDSSADEICRLYREFIIEKTHKNMGFSIKKIREKMLTLEDGNIITDESMNSVRSKLYKLIDFCIYYEYCKDENRCEENVRTLRSCMLEDEKEMFYDAEAQKIWNKHKTMFLRFANHDLSENNIKALQNRNTSELPSDWQKSVDSTDISDFSKFLYCMCFFLDGKEINDLLTTLINKFDVIANFIVTAKEIGVEVKFTNTDFNFFNGDVSKYVREINIVKNIARMKKPSKNAKETMYRDALYILGIPSDMSEEELSKKINDMLDGTDDKSGKKRHDFRNFIANNVINSDRFIYIIKFCDPKTARKIASDPKVVEFVLKESMPESIINRYYRSCVEPEYIFESDTINDKIKRLSNIITEMKFGKFEDVDQRSDDGTLAGKEKTRYIAVIGLYLNVVYQIVKNLVYVNSRYVMGFHALERDMKYIEFKDKDKDSKTCITEKILEDGESSANRYIANRHYRTCIEKDIDNSDKNAINIYRNNVAHLTAIRKCGKYINDIRYINSYFALYHYLMQRCIADGYDSYIKNNSQTKKPKTSEYFDSLAKYKTYVGDFVKALNTPFGYNAPRFKNLSIEGLFDKNNPKDLTKK